MLSHNRHQALPRGPALASPGETFWVSLVFARSSFQEVVQGDSLRPEVHAPAPRARQRDARSGVE